MKKDIFFTKSVSETQKIAQHLARSLKGSEILALYGNLGSGKTTFVQGLARGLGINERIISPTFIIIREYKSEDKKFYHVDLYRIQKENIEGLELGEILNNEERIVAIEWAEKIKNILPEKRTDIFFEGISENERRITVVKHG